MYKITSLKWDISKLSDSLGIKEESVMRFLRDGRNSAFLLKFKLSSKLNWEMVECYNAPTHLIDPEGDVWVIKTCTSNSGVSFCTNSMIGKGRKFAPHKFIEDVNAHQGFLVGDVTQFPKVSVYSITSKEVLKFYEKGLVPEGRMTEKRFRNVVNALSE